MPKGTWREFDHSGQEVLGDHSLVIPSKEQRKVRVRRTRAGKAGKTVTVISGLQLSAEETKFLLKKLVQILLLE